MRRISRSLLAAGAALAATLPLLCAATAAHADDFLDLELSYSANAIAQGVNQESAGKPFTVAVNNFSQIAGDDVTVTVDTSGATGVVSIAPAPGVTNCQTTATTMTCTFGTLDAWATADLPLVVRTRDDAAVNATASLRFDVTGKHDGTTSGGTYFHSISVADPGPDLLAAPPATVSGVQPGSTVAIPTSVTNVGDRTANGITFRVQQDGLYLSVPPGLNGCTYGEQGDLTVVCSFPDAVVPPGGTFAFSTASGPGVPVTVAGNARNRYESGVPVNAEPIGAYDVDAADNGAQLMLGVGDNPSDLAAVGTSVSGAVGDAVPATVGVTDNGPADLDYGAPGQAFVVVTAPTGTVFSGLPDPAAESCAQVVDGQPAWDQLPEPGYRQYECYVAAQSPLRAGATHEWTFQITIQDATVGSDGSVSLVEPDLPDPDLTNNTAPLTVTG